MLIQTIINIAIANWVKITLDISFYVTMSKSIHSSIYCDRNSEELRQMKFYGMTFLNVNRIEGKGRSILKLNSKKANERSFQDFLAPRQVVRVLKRF